MTTGSWNKRSLHASLVFLSLTCVDATAQSEGMSFFVTGSGLGNGADLGGLAGADKHCQMLATVAGAGSHTWRAYLSADKRDGVLAVNARDRIGKGPWRNAKGEVIAKDLEQLHGGRRAAMADPLLRWSAITIAPSSTTRSGGGHGTRRICRAAAARKRCAPRAVTDCSTASRPTEPLSTET